MILDSATFKFDPPSSLSRARRVLIKPFASKSAQYPHTVSAAFLKKIITGIRQVSDADIMILEGSGSDKPMKDIYQDLKYNFTRALLKDVRNVDMVEIDNPLLKPLIMPTFQIPNIILSSDFLISVTPLRIVGGQAQLTIPNLMSLITCTKQNADSSLEISQVYIKEKAKVLTDLYYTIPFDLGIVDASEKLICKTESSVGDSSYYGRVFIGDPYQVDREVTQTLGIRADYLKMIDDSRADLDL